MNIAPVLNQQSAETAAFFRDGYAGPIPVFTKAQCALVLRYLRRGKPAAPLDWEKGRGPTDRFFYDLATRPRVLALLRPLLGENIILWGVNFTERDPGQIHPWHVDIESSTVPYRFVSIWIGLENTSRESALYVVSRSHRFEKVLQQVQAEKSFRRGQAPDETVLAWAHEFDPAAAFIKPEMTDGEAILFDGRLWHATNNHRKHGRRIALILQYAVADQPMRIPDLTQLEWPFRAIAKPLLPAILVNGRGDEAANRLVPPPSPLLAPPTTISSYVGSLVPKPSADPNETWNLNHLSMGSTALPWMSCHWSVLSRGHDPRFPDCHPEEELRIFIDGGANLHLDEDETTANAKHTSVQAGSLVFAPALYYHCIRNPHAKPANYVVFRFRGAAREAKNPLGPTIVHAPDLLAAGPLKERTLLDQETNYLARLHAYVTELAPGAQAAWEGENSDHAIVLWSGRVEANGQIAEGPSLIYRPGGETLGLKNAGDKPARCLAVEFCLSETGGLQEWTRDARATNGGGFGLGRVGRWLRRAVR